jgi:hypothetical protein
MLCRSCNGTVGRYCDEGKRYKIDADADFYAESLATIPTKAERQVYMAKFYPRNYFDVPALNEAIKKRYQAIKNKAVIDD